MAYKNSSDPRAREARRKHYRNNKKQYYENNKLKKLRMMQYIWEVKDVPCYDCHKKYPPFVMDFDHRDPTMKSGGIAKFISRQSWTKLKAEIAKCDIVCSNCHRIRTAELLKYRWTRILV